MASKSKETKQVTVTRKNKETGTKVTVTFAAGLKLDPEKGAWATKCEDHGAIAQWDKIATRDEQARHPSKWCYESAKDLKARKPQPRERRRPPRSPGPTRSSSACGPPPRRPLS